MAQGPGGARRDTIGKVAGTHLHVRASVAPAPPARSGAGRVAALACAVKNSVQQSPPDEDEEQEAHDPRVHGVGSLGLAGLERAV